MPGTSVLQHQPNAAVGLAPAWLRPVGCQSRSARPLVCPGSVLPSVNSATLTYEGERTLAAETSALLLQARGHQKAQSVFASPCSPTALRLPPPVLAGQSSIPCDRKGGQRSLPLPRCSEPLARCSTPSATFCLCFFLSLYSASKEPLLLILQYFSCAFVS